MIRYGAFPLASICIYQCWCRLRMLKCLIIFKLVIISPENGQPFLRSVLFLYFIYYINFSCGPVIQDNISFIASVVLRFFVQRQKILCTWKFNSHQFKKPLYFRWAIHRLLYHLVLPWRHNGRCGVSNHQPHDCLLNRLFECGSKKTSKLCVTGPRWISRTNGQ